MTAWARTSLLLFILVLLPFTAQGQGTSQQPAPSDQQLLKPEELDALVAPIALYPDALLSQILMASTYPLEVIEAERWVTANKNLKGDALKAAIDKQRWDDSVKSLVATPSVLDMMSDKLVDTTARRRGTSAAAGSSWMRSSGCARRRRPTTSSRRTNSRR